MKTKRMENSKSGLSFVLSTPVVDRSGDRVKQNWNLSDFQKNPIALFGHMHDKIIGTWDLAVKEGKLVGDLILARPGTSPLVDEVRSLIEQDILKATSIGFSSDKVKENEFGGYDLDDNMLYEVSVVAVGANQEALRKSLKPFLSEKELDSVCTVDGCSRVKSFEDQKRESKKSTNIKKGFSMKTLSERIKELQDEIVASKDIIKGIAENEEATDEQNETMLAATGTVQVLEKRLTDLTAAEQAIASTVKEKQQVTKVEKSREKGELATRLFVAIAKAHVSGKSVVEEASDTYSADKDVVKFAKAVTAPADTGTTGWATELVQTGYGEFLDLLYPETVYGKVGAKMLYFGKNGSLIVPSWAARGNLAGSFVAEGAPIPVRQGQFTSKTLTPKKMAVISTFTREILTKSVPAVEQLVKTAIIRDTANAIDTAFLDATAGSTTRPAGLLDPTETGAANIVASTGATVSAILEDVKGVFGRLTAAQMGQSGVWLMNPITVLGLATKQISTGQFAFAEVNQGTFAGMPIVVSTNVPTTNVFFVDDVALTKASDIAPEFTTSNQATLVMDTAPVAIDAVSTEAVRSMFQTDTIALRFILGLDWAIQRQGGVQCLTGVAW